MFYNFWHHCKSIYIRVDDDKGDNDTDDDDDDGNDDDDKDDDDNDVDAKDVVDASVFFLSRQDRGCVEESD
jgi:hypothetical protein